MNQDEAYARGIKLIEPHIRFADRSASSGPQARNALRQGVGYLTLVLGVAPRNWAAWWVRGKAEQALDDHEAAYNSFGRSYSINCQNVDVGRELVAECLATGRSAEAVRVAGAISSTEPNNSGLLANLALAYLIDGQIEKAQQTVDAASQLDGVDVATASLKRWIEDVKGGHRPRPPKVFPSTT